MVLGACACSPDSGGKDSAGEPLPSEGELRVLTYNVAGLPDGISSAGAPLLERMPQIATLLEDYDVVGLQEDFDGEGHAALVGDATHSTTQWFDTLVSEERVYGAGLAQLSRTDVGGYYEEHYELCNGVFDGASDCLASKGFQVLTLSLGGEKLDFYNTHHEAGGGEEDEAARLSQVDQVIAAVAARSSDHAVLYTGDFNLHPEDAEDAEDAEPLARYDAAGLARSCDLLDCAEPNHIDQVRLRSSPTLEVWPIEWSRETVFVDGEGADLSDHPAIAITLGWRRVE
jgi:endonuclease/exonuclease/phosphatase family metal-dependent hydrolase